MTWEWEHHHGGGQWTVTIAGWHAVVQRVVPVRTHWQATLEHTSAPDERYVSPLYPEAVDARTWCLRTIAELNGKTS